MALGLGLELSTLAVCTLEVSTLTVSTLVVVNGWREEGLLVPSGLALAGGSSVFAMTGSSSACCWLPGLRHFDGSSAQASTYWPLLLKGPVPFGLLPLYVGWLPVHPVRMSTRAERAGSQLAEFMEE